MPVEVSVMPVNTPTPNAIGRVGSNRGAISADAAAMMVKPSTARSSWCTESAASGHRPAKVPAKRPTVIHFAPVQST